MQFRLTTVTAPRTFCTLALLPLAALAQGLGVASLGATGGLTIPSAYVLPSGDAALSLGNYQDPKLGTYDRELNMTLGFGLLPGVELFGRFAEYTSRKASAPGAPDLVGAGRGISDISASVKWQLPIDMPGLPKLALGATDLSGGSVYFGSVYAVASDQVGPLRWSLGYARGKAAPGRGAAKVLDGLFGGAEFKLGSSRATLLAESDGTQRHAGVRYYSEVLPWLGDAQLVGTLQRSFGATNAAGQGADATSANVSLLLPLGTDDVARRRRVDAAAKPLPALPLPGVAQADGGMVATTPDRLDALAKALRATGLDRVRVGMLGTQLVVEYQNHRYLHNEADALGVVLGLAAELAPAGSTRVHAITRKAGQVVHETSVDVAAYQGFLRDGDAARVRDTLGFGRLPAYDDSAVQWAAGEAGAGARQSWLRLQLKPLLNYTLGTEFGAFDYSLAANARATVGLWQGAELYTDVVQRLANSDNMEPGRVFASSLHRNGLKTVALQQSFWLGPRLFASVGAGRYNHDSLGAEGESMLFLPWNADSLHFKGSYLRQDADVLPRTVEAYAASYRWRMNPATWLEAGYQQYTDTSTGPSLTFTRWFDDVAVQVFARKGGNNSFVGLELSLPLGPRQGMAAGPLQVTGTPRFALGIRTRLTNGSNAGNYVDDAAVRPVDLNYKPEIELLNSGRITPADIKSQVQRMRESFYLYAREHIK